MPEQFSLRISGVFVPSVGSLTAFRQFRDKNYHGVIHMLILLILYEQFLYRSLHQRFMCRFNPTKQSTIKTPIKEVIKTLFKSNN